VTQVKKTYVSEIDRLLVKHGRGDHAPCYKVPNAPDISPILPNRNTKRLFPSSMRRRLKLREEKKAGALKAIRILRHLVGPSLNRAKVGLCE